MRNVHAKVVEFVFEDEPLIEGRNFSLFEEVEESALSMRKRNEVREMPWARQIVSARKRVLRCQRIYN